MEITLQPCYTRLFLFIHGFHSCILGKYGKTTAFFWKFCNVTDVVPFLRIIYQCEPGS